MAAAAWWTYPKPLLLFLVLFLASKQSKIASLPFSGRRLFFSSRATNNRRSIPPQVLLVSGTIPATPSHHRPPGTDMAAQMESYPRPPRSVRSAQIWVFSDRRELPDITNLPILVILPLVTTTQVGFRAQTGSRPPEIIGIFSGEEDGVDDKLEDLLVPLASGVDEGLIEKMRDQSDLLTIVRADTSFKVKVRDLFVLLANSILPGADVGFKEKLKGPCVLFAEAFSQVGDGAHLGE